MIGTNENGASLSRIGVADQFSLNGTSHESDDDVGIDGTSDAVRMESGDLCRQDSSVTTQSSH